MPNPLRTLVRLSLCLFAVLVPDTGSSQTAQELWESIGSSALDPGRAVALENVVIEMAHGELEVVSGVLVPAAPVAGRSLEYVFLGDGRFRFRPPDEAEADQLERFTGHDALDAEIDSAVLVLGRSELASTLLEHPATELDDAMREQATSLFQAWVSGPERPGFGADAVLLGIAVGDRFHEGYFALKCASENLGSFYYLVDPTEPEQVKLGQFRPSELDDIERHKLDRYIRKQRRQGRLLGLSLDELGDWNTWVFTKLHAADGEPINGYAGLEPDRYVLEATVSPGEGRIEGKARVHLRAEVDGKRLVAMRLHRDLEVQAVRDGKGRQLFWARSGWDLHVVLAEATRRDEKLDLAIDYGGVLLDEEEPGIFALRTTGEWYPRVGTVDRATYDVTLRWPKRHELLASGRVVEEGVEAGLRWERRVLEVPGIAFSFEVGAFDVVTDQAGHIALTFGFSKASGSIDKGAKDAVVETVKEALSYFEQQFGAYPFDHMTIATVPRDFSQGYPSFLTLSHYLIWTPKGGGRWVVYTGDGAPGQSRAEQRVETVAHEVSHQWWGNKVGWDSYRDQWLSEALANYSAVDFTARQEGKRALYLARNAARRRSSMSGETKDGTPYDTVGPVVLGSRLDEAYRAVVYDKGAVVFSMLARALGPDRFNPMLKNLADAVNNRVIDTATFIMAMERMSATDLAGFADQFIYGTGTPEVYYTFRFVPGEDGGWVIDGEARQIARTHDRFTVRRRESSWAVEREKVPGLDTSGFSLVVPFQVALKSRSPEESGKKSRSSWWSGKTEKGLGGTLEIRGEQTRFSIPIKQEPRNFWFDQRGEILAHFYSESHQPKRMLRYRAMELPAEQAEKLLQRALEAPVVSEQAAEEQGLKLKDLKLDTKLENAKIYLELAKAYLDAGRETEARAALDSAVETLGAMDKHRYSGTRTVLESWLDVHASDFASAYSKLSKFLRLDFPRRATDTLQDAARRKRFKTGTRWSAEAYALLAVAAHETGHEAVARQACKEAEERGADVAALYEVLSGS